jgi:hypothetical protein
MEKPSPSHQAETSPSVVSVLKVISDEKAFVLFNNIVVYSNANDKFISLKEFNLSTMQYYSRLWFSEGWPD